MKSLFLIFILSFNLFGANYIDEFPTYVYGDIRPIAAIYNAIAMITDSEIYSNLIKLAVLFSVVSIGWLMIFNKDLLHVLKGGSFTVGTIAVLLVPVDVHLVDKRLDKGLITNYYFDNTLGYEKISNVPWLIALTPSVATTISSDLIELSDLAFKGNTTNYSGMQDIGKTGFASLGYNKSYDMINKIIDKYSFDEVGTLDASNFKKDFKIYLVDCVIPKTVSNTQATTKLINPDKDVYSAISPIEIGLTSADELTKRDGTITDCVSFYSEIMNNLKGLTSDTYSTLSKISGTPDINQISGIGNIMLAQIQSTVFTSTTEQLAVYAQNLAAAPLIKATIEDYYRGTGISGQDIANQITASKSTATIQTQGLGQFKWMAQILPYAMHFLFGIILASSIFTLVMILARGTFYGTMIAKNYFGGFIQFEAIRVALSLVNNLVMYYSTIGAADKLVEFGGNPLAATRVPAYLDYVATMEGVSGILAISAIFLIPAIAMKGDVSSIASSMQGLSGRYVGNDVETARDATSKSSARQRAVGNIMNDEQAMKKLDQMGLSVPPDRMPLDYYNAVTNDLANMSTGIGNMLSQDNMNNFSKGTVASTVSKVANTAGYGSSVNMLSAENVSYQDGQAQGYQTNATENYRNKSAWNANSVGTGRAIESVGKDLSTMAITDLASSDSGFASFAKGSSNQGAISTAKTQGAGGINLSTDDLNKIGDTVKASIQSEIGKGAGVQENYKKYGENVYRDSAEYGERSGMAKTMEKLKAQNGIDNAVQIDANDSMIKAYQQEGSISGTMKAYNNKVKGSGRTMGQIIEALAQDMAEGKTSADIATVDSANANGGYVNYQTRSANEKTTSGIASLNGKENAGMINESGALTKKGTSTVSGASELQSYQMMGNVAGMMNVMRDNPQYVEDFVNSMITQAGMESKARKDAVVTDLMKSGLVSKNDDGTLKVNSGNFAEAKAFLNANNMNSHNSLVAGGMNFSGALGANSSVQATSLNSLSTGNKGDQYINDNNIHTGAAFRSALQSFLASGGKEDDVQGFINFVKNSQLSEAHKNGIFGHLSAGVAEATGMSQENAETAVAAGGAALGALGLNKMVGNPLGKTAKLLKKITDKFRGVGDETTDNTPNSSQNKNTTNTNDDTINNRDTNNHTNSSSKDNPNYNTNGSDKPINYNEKSLNEQKNDLTNKNPDDLARQTFKNQAQIKLQENLNDFRAGNIDAQTFGKRNADLSSFMSKVNNGSDISMRDLKGVDIKPIQNLPLETKISKNNKPYEVINTSAYGEQLKEIEAQKIRVAEENLSKFDSDGNPKVEVSEIKNENNIPQNNDAKLAKQEIKHPKIDNFMTEVEAKTSGALETFKKLPFIGKVAGVALAGATFAEASDAFKQGDYGKALFTATSIADPTGASDMALATIESRELQKQALGNRTVTGIGNGWKDDLKNSSIGKQVSGAIDSVGNMFSSDTNTSASNMASALKDGQVRNEMGSIYKEQMSQNQMMTSSDEQLKNLQMMEMKNTVGNVEEQMKALSDISISSEELEQLQKDLKKMRMKSGN